MFLRENNYFSLGVELITFSNRPSPPSLPTSSKWGETASMFSKNMNDSDHVLEEQPKKE